MHELIEADPEVRAASAEVDRCQAVYDALNAQTAKWAREHETALAEHNRRAREAVAAGNFDALGSAPPVPRQARQQIEDALGALQFAKAKLREAIGRAEARVAPRLEAAERDVVARVRAVGEGLRPLLRELQDLHSAQTSLRGPAGLEPLRARPPAGLPELLAFAMSGATCLRDPIEGDAAGFEPPRGAETDLRGQRVYGRRPGGRVGGGR